MRLSWRIWATNNWDDLVIEVWHTVPNFDAVSCPFYAQTIYYYEIGLEDRCSLIDTSIPHWLPSALHQKFAHAPSLKQFRLFSCTSDGIDLQLCEEGVWEPMNSHDSEESGPVTMTTDLGKKSYPREKLSFFIP